ncbi:hypothetical protein M0804_008274 [Polistes exclamans]|nr:hypothetical protein M0804_008274 [Polistes exclamans]
MSDIRREERKREEKRIKLDASYTIVAWSSMVFGEGYWLTRLDWSTDKSECTTNIITNTSNSNSSNSEKVTHY